MKIDDLFVDEAHKLASNNRDSERSLIEYNAIEMTLSKYKDINVYFSSPNISNPQLFLNLFGRNPLYSKHVAESPVTQHIFLIDVDKKSIRNFIRNDFFNVNSRILSNIDSNEDFILKVGHGKNSNMIYCSSGEVSVNSAISFMKKIESVGLSDEIKNAINSISELVHKDYYLVKCLYKRVAYHHGKLPHTVRGIVEELFRKGEIDYMFCTPTLAEGVNMPTKNIFIICEDKIRYTQDNESNKIKSLNFWNLAGRAGRYRSELSGNVFCLNSKSKSWDNNLSIFKDKSVKIDSTIEKNIKSKSKVKKLESLLSGNVNHDDYEEAIKHLSNIICIDTLRFPADFTKSNTLRIFINSNLSEIVKLASKRAQKIKDIPIELLNSFRSLDFNIQNDIYQHVKHNELNANLPNFTYESCFETLNKLHKIYKWEENEKIKASQILYYNKLMNDWVNGKSINQIIVNSINYYNNSDKELYIIKNKEITKQTFNGSLEHINHIIENIFEDLEMVLRFKFERYFNHYYRALVSVNGEENSKNNWATYLEYGSNNPVVIELQTMGISRFTAINILKSDKTKRFIKRSSNNNKLEINTNALLDKLPKDSFEYKELSLIF